jgi:SAM-dependent methyltransferase
VAPLANLLDDATLSGGLPYFDYEYRVANEIVIPWLRRYLRFDRTIVGDFGCHQGGVLQAFREIDGVAGGQGFDLNVESIARSPFANDDAFRIQVGDILQLDPARHRFSLILIRDVLEHIASYRDALLRAKACLEPGGHIFISYPPYYSPFGGHQQVASNWTRLAPWLHYLPKPLFFGMMRIDDNAYMKAADSIGDLESVRATRLTLRGAERAFRDVGLERRAAQYFLFRPEFKVRYGIPVIPAGPLARVPLLREALVMGVYYLLTSGRP